MKRFLIKEVKCELTEGFYPGVVVSVRFETEGNDLWMSNVEIQSIPNFYLSNKDMFEHMVKDDPNDDEYTKWLQETFLYSYDDLNLEGRYEDIFDGFKGNEDNPAINFIRYIIAVTRCDNEDTQALIDMAINKYVDELDIPISDVEMDYNEDND